MIPPCDIVSINETDCYIRNHHSMWRLIHYDISQYNVMSVFKISTDIITSITTRLVITILVIMSVSTLKSAVILIMWSSFLQHTKCCWFSPFSFTNKTDCHNITEILLKVKLSIHNLYPLHFKILKKIKIQKCTYL